MLKAYKDFNCRSNRKMNSLYERAMMNWIKGLLLTMVIPQFLIRLQSLSSIDQ